MTEGELNLTDVKQGIKERAVGTDEYGKEGELKQKMILAIEKGETVADAFDLNDWRNKVDGNLVAIGMRERSNGDIISMLIEWQKPESIYIKGSWKVVGVFETGTGGSKPTTDFTDLNLITQADEDHRLLTGTRFIRPNPGIHEFSSAGLENYQFDGQIKMMTPEAQKTLGPAGFASFIPEFGSLKYLKGPQQKRYDNIRSVRDRMTSAKLVDVRFLSPNQTK